MENTDLSNIKGIIFDYGGTIDTNGDHWSEVIWAAYQRANLLVDKADYREAYVFAERELARTLHILPHHNFHDMLSIKIPIQLNQLVAMGKFSPEFVALKGAEIAGYCYESARESVENARPVLESLSKRYPLVLVSNFYGNVHSVLADFDIEKYFRQVIESAVVGVRKPDPRIFQLGVEALGIKPEETLVIGDSLKKDIIPAESIGCHTLRLNGKPWTEDENNAYPHTTIENLREILNFLEGE
jgi:putative hydrolase of the HAD superfamily